MANLRSREFFSSHNRSYSDDRFSAWAFIDATSFNALLNSETRKIDKNTTKNLIDTKSKIDSKIMHKVIAVLNKNNTLTLQ